MTGTAGADGAALGGSGGGAAAGVVCASATDAAKIHIVIDRHIHLIDGHIGKIATKV